MFKKLRQKIEESDAVKKANDSLGKYWPAGAGGGGGGSGSGSRPESPPGEPDSSSAGSDAAATAGPPGAPDDDDATEEAPPPPQSLLARETEKLRRELAAAQDRAAKFRDREAEMVRRLAARDRLVEVLRAQAALLAEGKPVPDQLAAEIRQAEADAPPVAQNGGGGGGCGNQEAAELPSSRQAEASAEVDALKFRLAEAAAEAEAAARRHRDERAVAQEEAAAGKRRLKQRLAEAQQQLAAREREAALKDSTGATRESEIRTLKERLDCRLASERRLRDEADARSAEATALAEQLRASRLEAEGLARQVREQRRQLETGRARGLAELEGQHADRLKAAAREFQDRLEAKEREFRLQFQEAVERFQEAEGRARAAHRLETEELLQGLEAREVAEGRLARRLEAAEAEAAAAAADLAAAQAEAAGLREAARDATAELAAAEAESAELRGRCAELLAELRAAEAASATPASPDGRAPADSIRSAQADVRSRRLTGDGERDLLGKLAERVQDARAAAALSSSSSRHPGDSVSHEDYEAVKMYAADLQKQLMSVSAELAEQRSHQPLPSPCQEVTQYQFTSFTDIPEIEYLRHVLFKYMLGEKTQTLARVICTVLKFSESQIQQVMDHEGRRAAMVNLH